MADPNLSEHGPWARAAAFAAAAHVMVWTVLLRAGMAGASALAWGVGASVVVLAVVGATLWRTDDRRRRQLEALQPE